MRNITILSGVMTALACTLPAYGAGFAINENGTGAGLAYANASAGAPDASTLFGNPAGMTYLHSRQVVAGTSYFASRVRFRSDGAGTYLRNRTNGEMSTIDPLANPDPMTGFLSPASAPELVTGNDGGSAGASDAVPYFFWHQQFGEKTHFGLGVTVPFAASTQFDEGWIGRYHTVSTELSTLNINPAVAFRLSERVSLGAGLDFLYAKATQEKAVDFRYEAAALEAFTGTPLPREDGRARISGDAWGAGYNLGLIVGLNDATRIGIAYRSRITPHLKGSYRVDVPEVYSTLSEQILGSNVFGSQSRDASGQLKLPASLSIGAVTQLTPRLAVMADWLRTYWSRFDEFRIRVEGGDVPDQVQVQNWRDANRFAVGVNYALTDQWGLQAGLSYDQTPVSSARYRHPSVPDADRRNITFGATYQPDKRHRFHAAFMHTRRNRAPVNYSETAANPVAYPFNADQVFDLEGQFEMRVNMINLNYIYSF